MENIFNEIEIFFTEIIDSITIENVFKFIKSFILSRFENTIIYTFIYIFIYLFLIILTIRLMGKINHKLEIKRSFKNRFIRFIVRILNIIPIIALNIGYVYLIYTVSFPISEFIYDLFKILSKISSSVKIILLQI